MSSPLSEPIRGERAVALIVTLSAAIFVGVTIGAAPLVLLPSIAADLGVSVSVVGQISSSAIFLTFVLAVGIGPLIQRHGYRRLYLAGTLAMALCAGLMAASGNVVVLFVAALCGAFANAITLPVALAIAATQLTERTSHRAMSYQIACVFAAVAVGLPGVVLLASAVGWRSAFAMLAAVPVVLLVGVLSTVPVGRRDANSSFKLLAIVRGYRALFDRRTLGLMYVFQVLYVICAFGSAAYASALIHSRGFSAADFSAVLAVVGVAFVASSLAAGEIIGRLKLDLRIVIAAGAVFFCVARGGLYLTPLPLGEIMALFGVAALCDGAVAVAMRAYVASHDVPDRALSMVFFGACDSLGQALGGVITGAVLAAAGLIAIGGLAYGICIVATCLFVLSQWRSQPSAVPEAKLG